MQLKGKQIKDSSVQQEKLNVTTESITNVSSVTNAEYVNTNSVDRVEAITYATSNMNMLATGATIGDIACLTAVIEFPISNIMVKVNNISVTVGAAADCYFSPDGVEIRTGGNAEKGDFLYWNSSRFDLDNTDEIDFIYLVSSETVILEAGSTQVLDPYYPALNVKYTGADDTSMTITIDGVDFITGNVGGFFVWDIGGANETTMVTEGESVIQDVNGEDYTIWFDGFGSLLFSVKEGNFKIEIIINSFGNNTKGSLGTGDETNFDGIIQVVDFPNAKKIECGTLHTLILMNDGTVQSFGFSVLGQLGTGDNTDYNGLIQTLAFTNVMDIICGTNHTFILFNDGTVQSFGSNDNGELGMGTTTEYNGAIQTPAFTNVKSVSSGANYIFTLFNDGTVQSFGNNIYGQLGMGNTIDYNGTIQTPAFTNVKSVSSGSFSVFVLFNDGTVQSFGANHYGQLGMGNTTDYYGAIQTPAFTNVIAVECGGDTSYILFNDSTVKSFGYNSSGQLGMGNTTDYNGAIQTPAFTNVKKISNYDAYTTIVLFNDNTIQTFGFNGSGKGDGGQLLMGNETDYNGAIQTPPFTNVKDIFSIENRVFIIYVE